MVGNSTILYILSHCHYSKNLLNSLEIMMLLTQVPFIGQHDKDNCFPVLHLFLDTDSSSCLEAVPSLFQVRFINLDPFSNVRLFAFNHMVLSSACVLYS